MNVSGVLFPRIAFLGLLNKGNERENVVQTSQIVTIGSVGGFIRILGTSFTYNPSKAAANHLAKIMATNFVQWGINRTLLPLIFSHPKCQSAKGSLTRTTGTISL
ncbi:hypothetical protein GGS24DRAFT_450686 [Hypoxylon argillaceum]|nr:hypothetical protein GGS24DRAFT_450686 [Hypoxylon argillaceum]